MFFVCFFLQKVFELYANICKPYGRGHQNSFVLSIKFIYGLTSFDASCSFKSFLFFAFLKKINLSFPMAADVWYPGVHIDKISSYRIKTKSIKIVSFAYESYGLRVSVIVLCDRGETLDWL